MKTVAITAMLGALIAIPFLMRRRNPALLPVVENGFRLPPVLDSDLRYDVSDFLTE